MVKSKIISAIIIPMLLMSVGGYVYAHWTGNVLTKYKFHFFWADVTLESYQVLTDPLYTGSIGTIDPDWINGTRALRISAVVPEPGWYMWIGLVIHNNGLPSVLIDKPTYEFNGPSDISSNITSEEYFFGPYDETEFSIIQNDPLVWDGIQYNQLPPSITQASPPVTLAHCERLILWIKLQLNPAYQGPVNLNLGIAVSMNVELT